MSSFKDFMAKPHYLKQYGSFPLYVRLSGERFDKALPQRIFMLLPTVVLGFAASLSVNDEKRVVETALLVAVAVIAMIAHQTYYGRKGENLFQLYREQYRLDKESVAFLKRSHFG